MKKFSTYEEQIEKLKTDGLLIKQEDENRVLEIIKFEGYFNIINGYSFFFKDRYYDSKGVEKKKYRKNTTIESISKLYNFDKNLQILIYKYSMQCECKIKALLAHVFSKHYDVREDKYLNEANFNETADVAKINDLIDKCKELITDSCNRESKKYKEYVAYTKNVHGHIPLWVLIRVMPLGMVSKFYNNLKKINQQEIACEFGISEEELASMLKLLVNFRNVVAHGERTFCIRFKHSRIPNMRVHKSLSIPQHPHTNYYEYGTCDFLGLFIVFKYLLSDIDFVNLSAELQILLDNLIKEIDPTTLGIVKSLMGLKTGAWIKLHKIEK